MILFPPLFGLIFVLLLIFKLLGGSVSWILVIIFGALFVIPLCLFIFMWIRSSMKKGKIEK
ncbi:MAG: hypothetical protein ACJA0H_001192 [Francisellaceae bacterium]|jgi:hypothetical protein